MQAKPEMNVKAQEGLLAFISGFSFYWQGRYEYFPIVKSN